jgi:peroxiredoxin family protein/TusA-related sulfurtransferase
MEPTMPTPKKELKDDTGEKSVSQITPPPTSTTLTIDACGLQCPGPILKLKEALDTLQLGQVVTVQTKDPGFERDVEGFCQSTGNTLLDVKVNGKTYEARIQKGATYMDTSPRHQRGDDSKDKTMVVFSGDFDKAMAAFIIANGAAAMGSKVMMFFTFWGLNILRKPIAPPTQKNLVEKMFGWMMPQGAEKAGLSKMNMLGMGKMMIQGIMRKKNVASITELIQSAQKNDVKLIACSMSMDLMGIKPEELIEGVDQGGVAMYLAAAEKSTTNLFI